MHLVEDHQPKSNRNTLVGRTRSFSCCNEGDTHHGELWGNFIKGCQAEATVEFGLVFVDLSARNQNCMPSGSEGNSMVEYLNMFSLDRGEVNESRLEL